MRIGLTIYGSLNQRSGGYLYDRMLVEALRKRGHKVKVISISAHNYFLNILQNFSGSVLNQIKNLDLLLEDELNHPSLFLLNRRIDTSHKIPILSIVHHLRSSERHPWVLNLVFRSIEKTYLSSLDGFIFNSNTTKIVVFNLLGHLRHNVVANPGADRLNPRITSSQIRKRAHHKGPLRLVFVGSLTRRKAPHLILEAIAQIPIGLVQAEFAGDGAAEPGYAKGLQRRASELGISDQVQFLGHLAERQLAGLLAHSDLLVVPSSYEGFGIAYADGMGFGLPAIGTRSGAAGELIANGKNGYLILPGDSRELARRLKALAADRTLLARLSVTARRTYLKRETWQTSIRRIHEFLSFYN